MKFLIYYYLYNFKYIIRIFFLLIKIINSIGSFDFMQFDTEILMNEDDNSEKKKKFNNIMFLTFPIRQLLYIWLSLKFCENFSDNMDVNSILNIIVIVEIIDKSITEAINEDNSIDDSTDKLTETVEEVNNELKEEKEQEIDN